MLTFSHVAISCQNPIATEQFYTKYFGFQRARVIPLGEGQQIVFIKSGTVYLELFQAERNEGPVLVVVSRRPNPDRLQDFETWLEGICAAASEFPGHRGVNILRPSDPVNQDYIVTFQFDTHDQLKAWETSPVRSDWLDRALPFTAGDARTQKMTGPIPQPDQDGSHYTGWRHIAFQVDDVDAKLAEMGDDANITLGPLDFDAFIPGWRTAWVTDPDGNIVEISQGYADQDNPPPLEL